MVPRLAEVLDVLGKVDLIVGKQPFKLFPARPGEIVFIEIWLFLLAGSDDPIKEMTTRKLMSKGG